MEGFKLNIVPEWVLERWMVGWYVIINENIKDLAERIRVRPEKNFYEVVSKHLGAYIQEGVMPPNDIAPAILNIADDYMAGRRPISIRAGDYISIQNYLRGSK